MTTRASARAAMAVRAFEIADAAMFVDLQSYGALSMGDASIVGLANAHGEVTKLTEAGDELREAFDWLQARGYVELATDDVGEFIRVLRRPAACAEPALEIDVA